MRILLSIQTTCGDRPADWSCWRTRKQSQNHLANRNHRPIVRERLADSYWIRFNAGGRPEKGVAVPIAGERHIYRCRYRPRPTERGKEREKEVESSAMGTAIRLGYTTVCESTECESTRPSSYSLSHHLWRHSFLCPTQTMYRAYARTLVGWQFSKFIVIFQSSSQTPETRTR